MKNFTINEQEKNRILEMHLNATKNHYLLNEQTLPPQISCLKNLPNKKYNPNTQTVEFKFSYGGIGVDDKTYNNWILTFFLSSNKAIYNDGEQVTWRCERGVIWVGDCWLGLKNGRVEVICPQQSTNVESTKVEPTKNASGYVLKGDKDFSVIDDNNKIMGVGSEGLLVKRVQHFLLNNGFSGGTTPITKDENGCKTDLEKCDGIYGKNTKTQVRNFQIKNPPLSKDGIVGKQTLDKMNQISNGQLS